MFDLSKIKVKRVLAMGDWHGHYTKAQTALDKAGFNEHDILICLGDYTDRGNENIACMKKVIELNELPNVVMLLGNHEYMLLEHFEYCAKHVLNKQITTKDIDSLDDNILSQIVDTMKRINTYNHVYLPNGGDTTLAEVNSDSLAVFKKYLMLIDTFRTKFRLSLNENKYKFLFVHAGINPLKKMNEQTIDDYIWIREQFFSNYHGDTTVVIGHTPVQYVSYSNIPVFSDNNIIFCDTGSYLPNGMVSVVDILTEEYWQA